MIDRINILLEKKHAYITKEGNIYFNVRSFDNYGKLSGRKLEEAVEGERIDNAKDKLNPEDFALWKKADKAHLMQWNSPWGRGYPGWHIECSVMSNKYLGTTIDIHGGGLENSFPHHECEIAQSEAASGEQFVKYFIHHNMLTVNGTKMGKSLGNFIILKDLFTKTNPIILRFYILMSHYRSPLDFTDEALNSAKAGFERMKNSVLSMRQKISKNQIEIYDNVSYHDVKELEDKFISAMDDDFNTPIAISVIYELLKLSNIEILKEHSDLNKLNFINDVITNYCEKILGLVFEDTGNNSIDDDLINLLIDLRKNYREEKNFKMSDVIRDKLKDMGIILKDGANGTTYSK
jgi:cysteinyl-tRNA synthetase